jgi:hypothetical protein
MENQACLHSYMELVELIGQALWSECKVLTYLWQYVLSFNLYLTHLPKVITGVNAPAKCKDCAAKTLDLVTASSIVAPSFCVLLEAPLLAQGHLPLKLAADVGLNLISPTQYL